MRRNWDLENITAAIAHALSPTSAEACGAQLQASALCKRKVYIATLRVSCPLHRGGFIRAFSTSHSSGRTDPFRTYCTFWCSTSHPGWAGTCRTGRPVVVSVCLHPCVCATPTCSHAVLTPTCLFSLHWACRERVALQSLPGRAALDKGAPLLLLPLQVTCSHSCESHHHFCRISLTRAKKGSDPFEARRQ